MFTRRSHTQPVGARKLSELNLYLSSAPVRKTDNAHVAGVTSTKIYTTMQETHFTMTTLVIDNFYIAIY